MERRLVVTLIGLMLGASGRAAPAPCTPSSVEPLSVQELSRNGAVVKSGTRHGMGYVVGWREGEAWIAVPAHVVFGPGVRPRDTAPFRAGLDVRLSGDTAARPLCGEDPKPPQGAADLSFVCVEWTGRPYFNEGVLARRVKEGDEVTLVDFASGDHYRGSVKKTQGGGETVGAVGDVEAQGFDGLEGQSGAIAANAAGIVGLYLGKETSRHLLSMPAIRSFAELALVPWQLTYAEYYDCAAVRNVCLTFETEVAPAGITLRSLFSPGAYPLPADGCAALPEGRYEIVVPPRGSTCEPTFIAVLSAAEDLRLSLRCSVALRGTWRTEDGDELLCVGTQMGIARCSGLGRQGLGIFDGTFNARGRSLSIAGSFYDAAGNRREASGSLRWSEGFLAGEIRRQLEPPRQLKLKRVEEP